MADGLYPSAMVPGLVTVKDKETGKEKNVFPVDAREMILAGSHELVDNGAAEAARLNVNPLRSGAWGGDPALVAVEVTGIAGAIVTGKSVEDVEAITAASNSPDNKPRNDLPPASANDPSIQAQIDAEERATNTGNGTKPTPAAEVKPAEPAKDAGAKPASAKAADTK